MKRFKVISQWRGVGVYEFDIFHRDTKKSLHKAGTLIEPEKLYCVIEAAPKGQIVADCYTRVDANRIARALNKEAA